MDDRVKVYESLLNLKGELEKECFRLSLDYALEFGDQIEMLFELKVEVITLKKKIAYCVQRQYRNQEILDSELRRYVDAEILDYQQKLQELIAFNHAARENRGSEIAYHEEKKIRKLYYEVVHLIHPDLHPEYQGREEISSLWNQAVSAYKRNDYHDLVEAYDHILILVTPGEVEIPHIEEKIAALQEEVASIKENEPYTYRYLLDIQEETNAYHEKLDQEISDYQEYQESLEGELERFPIRKREDA